MTQLSHEPYVLEQKLMIVALPKAIYGYLWDSELCITTAGCTIRMLFLDKQ